MRREFQELWVEHRLIKDVDRFNQISVTIALP